MNDSTRANLYIVKQKESLYIMSTDMYLYRSVLKRHARNHWLGLPLGSKSEEVE